MDKGAQQPYGTKAEPLSSPLSLPFPFGFPSFVVPSVCLFLSLHLFYPLAPLWYPYPPRTLQFSNGFVLTDYVRQRSTFYATRYVYAFIIRAFILAC